MSTRTRRRRSGSARDPLVEQRVEALAVALPPQHPGLVVDPGAVEGRPRRAARRPARTGRARSRRPSGTARATLRSGVRSREVLDVHRHRVGVVEQPRVGADLAHVAGEPVEDREGAQAAEHPTDAERVGDRLAHAVPRGHLEVGDGRGVPADVDRVDHEVGAGEGGPPVGLGPHLDLAGRGARPPAGPGPRPARSRRVVDVVHHEGERAEVVVGEQVAQQLAGELRRAGARRSRSWSCVRRAWQHARLGPNEQESAPHMIDSGQIMRGSATMGPCLPSPTRARHAPRSSWSATPTPTWCCAATWSRASARPSSCSTTRRWSSAGRPRSPHTAWPGSAARSRCSPPWATTRFGARLRDDLARRRRRRRPRSLERADLPTGLTVVLSRRERPRDAHPHRRDRLADRSRGAGHGRRPARRPACGTCTSRRSSSSRGLAPTWPTLLAAARERGADHVARHQRRPDRRLGRRRRAAPAPRRPAPQPRARWWRSPATAILAGPPPPWPARGPLTVVKDGAAGAFAVTPGGDLVEAAGIPVDAVDTTGAGDTFDAAFLDAWLDGVPTGRGARARRGRREPSASATSAARRASPPATSSRTAPAPQSGDRHDH